ncbi:hypothetical protein ABL78_3627 [Leptomonas seymouri]|uniref:Uncharacterized protein n=1 Tax=Leptomonas seymouri TaxID=5684 RepID=A0A0N1HZA2_LEPSE|nr:hypothetical protein ABL78_3627 [Leptomonas seymouri]|eukprot:KPI87290.1 hypothetical protein ABL78_3627 [Leptomonas seymouri]
MERQRKAQARHLELLSSDAPVMNRCAKEEVRLKQRLAQSTAALTRSARQNLTAVEREEHARDTQLQAQFTDILSKSPGIHVPCLATSNNVDIAAGAAPPFAVENSCRSKPCAASECTRPEFSVVPSHAADVSEGIVVPSLSSSPAFLLGYPEPFENSGFKSVVRWASVSYDETFLTAYGPRRLREEMKKGTMAEVCGLPTARDARPHRLMAAAACYLLNEVLCANPTLSSLWQEKLRQPIFDAVFSPQSIVEAQEKRKAYQSNGKATNEAVRSHVIVQQTLNSAAATTPNTSEEGDEVPAGAAPSPIESAFPPRVNVYATRGDFASMRLWTEEVTAEQREKAIVCRRLRNLQHVMERRMQLLQVYQKQMNVRVLRCIFTLWRTHTRQCRTHRAAMERFLENRRCRVLEENAFLRWRRAALQSKVELLQRRLLSIVAGREEAARQHAAALAAAQEQLNSEWRRHQQAAYEQDALHTQMLESHSVEVEALRLVLHQQRVQAAEMGKRSRRWERLAKTFRPAHPCPAVPPSMWSSVRALYTSEKSIAATMLSRSAEERARYQLPGSVIIPVQERLERLLLAWVNSIMEKSPLASSWVPLEKFMHGRITHPRSILVSQKSGIDEATRARGSMASGANAQLTGMKEFGVYALMMLVRELRRRYVLAGAMPDADIAEPQLPCGDTSKGEADPVTKCFHEVVQLLSAQTCAGLYPSLLMHCPSLSRWFSPEGVFGGPLKSFEGSRKARRLQHTMFIWLLTSLLVGHIRLTILAPAGEKDDGLPQPASDAANLRGSREADADALPLLNFFADTAAAAAASLGIEGDAKTSKSTAAPNTSSRGTSIVSKNTLLSKKVSTAASAKGSKFSSQLAKAITLIESAGAPPKGTVTLEMALRERSQQVEVELPDFEDSLADIEAYLGLLSAQSRTLRKSERNRERATSAAGSKETTMEGSENNTEENDDDLVNALLRQLVEARDAAAQRRRIRRMRIAEGSGGKAEDNDDSEGDTQKDDSAENDVSPRHLEGQKSTILTEGQLRILRSLPLRSSAFDTLRPIPSPTTKPLPASTDDPSATAPSQQEQAAATPPTGERSGKFYSFILNVLEDVTRRQQWADVARVVTSLVVRFHILDDVEDGAQRSKILLASREESQEDEPVHRPSSSRLPSVRSAVACDADAPGPKRDSAGMQNTAAATVGSSPPRLASLNGRVAAKLVPSRPSLSEPLHSASNTTSSKPNLVSVGKDLACTVPPNRHFFFQSAGSRGSSARDSALLDANEMHVRGSEMRVRGQDAAAASSSALNSQRSSASMHSTSEASLQAPGKDQVNNDGSSLLPSQQQQPAQPLAFSSEVTLPPSSLHGTAHSEGPPYLADVQDGDHSEEVMGAEQMGTVTQPGSVNSSMTPAPQDACLGVAHERGCSTLGENPASALQGAKLHERPPHSSLEFPAVSSAASSEAAPRTQPLQPPQELHVIFMPSQHQSELLGSAAPSPVLHPGMPTSDAPCTGYSSAEGAEAEEGENVHGSLGYLDPLIEHGPSQSSAAIENIRKDRFNMRH